MFQRSWCVLASTRPSTTKIADLMPNPWTRKDYVPTLCVEAISARMILSRSRNSASTWRNERPPLPSAIARRDSFGDTYKSEQTLFTGLGASSPMVTHPMAGTSEHAIRNELRTAVEFCVLTHDSRQGGIELPNRLCHRLADLNGCGFGHLGGRIPLQEPRLAVQTRMLRLGSPRLWLA